MLTAVTRDIASPEDAHDLPVSHRHEDQRYRVKEYHLDDREEGLIPKAPGHLALRVDDRLHLEVCRKRLQAHQIRDICGDGECVCMSYLIISRVG